MANTKAIRSLPVVQVEVLASSREEIGLRDANVTLLCHLVLEWIHRNWEPEQLNVDQLTAKVLVRSAISWKELSKKRFFFIRPICCI